MLVKFLRKPVRVIARFTLVRLWVRLDLWRVPIDTAYSRPACIDLASGLRFRVELYSRSPDLQCLDKVCTIAISRRNHCVLKRYISRPYGFTHTSARSNVCFAAQRLSERRMAHIPDGSPTSPMALQETSGARLSSAAAL